jgi:osmotically inducible lipoprotein OsmB
MRFIEERSMTIRQVAVAALLAAGLGLGGCTVDRQTGKSTMTGAATGAAGGAVVGLLSGNFLSSAGLGAAAGAASGFVYDQIQKAD